MNVVGYTDSLVKVVEHSDWECHWVEDHNPYLHIPRTGGEPRLYLSAGIHGDEPAGPMAVLSMLEDKSFFEGVEVFLFPLLNPVGMAAGTRENGSGIDLNRNFGPNADEVTETKRHIEVLRSLPRMDIALCLHEDWEASGVYLYHVDARKPRFNSRKVLEAMSQYLPVESAGVIDGSNAIEGLIQRHESEYTSDEWPESIYLCRTKTGASMTLETPSGAPLEQRVQAHQAAVQAVVRQLMKRS